MPRGPGQQVMLTQTTGAPPGVSIKILTVEQIKFRGSVSLYMSPVSLPQREN